VKGKIVSGKTPDSLTCAEPFCTYQSQPLSDFIGYMFKYSNNFAAEMLFKSFSIGRDTLAGTWDGSSCVVAEWWKERIGETTPTVRNGSGMGDVNRISPMQVVDLLKWVYHTKTIYPEFLSSLSTSGIDGTLKSRFLHSPLRGIIRAKTGTLNMYGVSTLAGYVLLPEKTLAFALLFNNAGSNQYRHWIMQKEILEHVVTRIQDTAG